MPRTLTRRLSVVLIGVMLTACSATRLAYNNLDSLLGWQLSRSLGLEAPQRAIFDRNFPPLWEWHRSTQLSMYVRDLRALGEAVQQSLPEQEVERYMQRTGEHFVALWQEIQPTVVRMLRSLDDRQVERLMERIAEWRQEQAAESAGQTPEQLQAKAAGAMQKSLERWTGRLSAGQRDRIRQWAAARRYAPELVLAYRESWAVAFRQVLDRRHEAGFEERLQALFSEPELEQRGEIAQLRAHNRGVWLELATDLSATLTARQRQHFQDEIESLAQDLEVLAARATPPNLGRVSRDTGDPG